VRKNCEKPEAIKWALFVRIVSNENFVSKEMSGEWADLLDKSE